MFGRAASAERHGAASSQAIKHGRVADKRTRHVVAMVASLIGLEVLKLSRSDYCHPALRDAMRLRRHYSKAPLKPLCEAGRASREERGHLRASQLPRQIVPP